jgi:hypothetical protein
LPRLRSNVILSVQDEIDIRPYYFEYQGEQTLEFPIGTIETLLFVRTRKQAAAKLQFGSAKTISSYPLK